MTTKSRTRRLATLVSASFLIAGTAIFSALPAQAAPGQPGPSSGKVAYAALGDSYSAGVGGGDYLDPCFRSPNSYASIIADQPGTVHDVLLGCAGASTTDVMLQTQLAGLDHRTKLVTLTVGANDLGLDAVTAACLGGPVELCLAAIAAAQANLGPLAASLSATLAAIDAAAPNATVIVTGYPLLINAPTDQVQALVNAGVAALNDVIEAAVLAAGDDFVYVDVESVFAGHGLGSADPWLVSPPASDAFHPNAAGYAAYADAILAAL